MKVSCLSHHLRPAAAVVDPDLTRSCPPKVTADTGIDALTHAVEAYTAIDQAEYLKLPPAERRIYQGKNPVADLFAVETFSLVGKFLRRAVRDGTDAEAREGMALAATLGGLAFSNAGVALIHAMEYPVGAAVHCSHGAGNGLLLPHVMRFNAGVRGDEIARIGRSLDASIGYGGSAADDAIKAVDDLRAAIGVPARLRDFGVQEADLPGFADKAAGIVRLMRLNPRYPTRDEILAIYRAAF